MAVRTDVGIFDISHMGDIVISGHDAETYVDYIFPSKVSDLKENKCMYTAFLNNDGNMIDDTIIYRLSRGKFFLIPNASNIEKIYRWMIDKYRRFYCNTVRDKDMYDIDYKREVNFQWKVFISGYYEDGKWNGKHSFKK